MNVDEFKKLKPEYQNVEGELLWNAMENYMLRQQSGQEVIKNVVPFFKRYQLRWLFYRRIANFTFSKGDYTSNERCKICKKGKGLMFFWQGKLMCAGLDHEYQEEPNISFKHKMYVVGKIIRKFFWELLDKVHLVRSSHHSRYDIFGDENKYVQCYTLNIETGKVTYTLKKRKWWEHLFIERSRFNF